MTSLASLIDHTLLRPEATEGDIAALCREAAAWGFACVCVNPFWVPSAVASMAGTGVRVCSVVGFPFGATPAAVKAFETGTVVAAGALEVDVVVNVGALRSGQLTVVEEELSAVVNVARDEGGALVKVILETAWLTDAEKRIVCQLAVRAGAAFMKTSTGFGPRGATVADVSLLRHAVGPDVGVKASGGVRDLATLRAMVDAGANRIGTSAGVAILCEAEASTDGDGCLPVVT
jgi:deoxyribose-phosphate aldolase